MQPAQRRPVPARPTRLRTGLAPGASVIPRAPGPPDAGPTPNPAPLGRSLSEAQTATNCSDLYAQLLARPNQQACLRLTLPPELLCWPPRSRHARARYNNHPGLRRTSLRPAHPADPTADGALNKQPTNSAPTGNAARASMAQPVSPLSTPVKLGSSRDSPWPAQGHTRASAARSCRPLSHDLAVPAKTAPSTPARTITGRDQRRASSHRTAAASPALPPESWTTWPTHASQLTHPTSRRPQGP